MEPVTALAAKLQDEANRSPRSVDGGLGQAEPIVGRCRVRSVTHIRLTGSAKGRALRSVVTNSITIAAASTVAVTFMSLSTEPPSPPTMRSQVQLSAATVGPTNPPPGALIEQFLVNQVENCSLICPFIIQGLVQVPLNFAALPLTLVRLLLSGEPLLQAAALATARGG